MYYIFFIFTYLFTVSFGSTQNNKLYKQIYQLISCPITLFLTFIAFNMYTSCPRTEQGIEIYININMEI